MAVDGSKLSCQGWTTLLPVFLCNKEELDETNCKLITHITDGSGTVIITYFKDT